MTVLNRLCPSCETPLPEAASFCPTCGITTPAVHGLGDQYLLHGALDRTWEWLEQDLTLVTIPSAQHFVQQDAADLVTRTMVTWLGR